MLGLAALLLFLIKYYGHFFATVVGVLLATFPGTIARSTAGFSDRDTWCWMLAVLAIVIYLHRERMLSGRLRILATVLCGFIVFLGGLSWEAFGIFVLIILSAEIWKFCTTDAEENLKEYLIWVLMFVPGLYLISPAYRSGYGFSTHVATLMLAPPLVLLILRSIRWLLLRCVTQFRPHAQKLAFGLILFGIAAGVLYVLGQYNTFATTAFPFLENRLMKTVGELKDPNLIDWVDRYGSMFILGSIGLIAIAVYLWNWKALSLAVGFVLLGTTIFLRDHLNNWIGSLMCDRLFIATFALTVIGFGIAATRKQREKRYELDIMVLLVWCLLWFSFTRTGLRYVFFVGIPLAIGTVLFLKHITTFRNTEQLSIQFFGRTFHHKHITVGLIFGILSLLLFLGPAGGYATGTLQAAAKRDAIPGQGKLMRAYQWMRNELPQDTTVMAAHWTYGIKLNILARVKTITDSDHYLPHWIHLYFRHVFCAQSEVEALHFLKTHETTHLMITSVELVPNAIENSFVGSDEHLDRHFTLYHLQPQPTSPGTQYSLAPEIKQTPPFTHTTTLKRIDVIGTDFENLTITAKFGKEETIQLPYVAFHGDRRILSTQSIDTEKGGLVFLFDKDKALRSSFYIPEIGWNSLAVRLFMRGEHSEAFELVHTVPTYGPGTHPDIQIWKINYPENIKPHPKYLVTE